jgi:protocatechuate 3,4-dioxygenase beta subunit
VSTKKTRTAGPVGTLEDFVRSDIRDGKAGTLLNLTIKVVNSNATDAEVADADVEIWHVDADGNYSRYGNQVVQTFLRGVQKTNAHGEVTFTTIYPGWYQGRATHIHAEVAVAGRSAKVMQFAFPETTSDAVYAQGAYATRGANPTSNARDDIFSDSRASELLTPSGAPVTGYSATVQIGIAV